MNDYSRFLFDIFELFESECCELNYKEILIQIKGQYYFLEEFSNCENDLSFKFIDSFFKLI